MAVQHRSCREWYHLCHGQRRYRSLLLHPVPPLDLDLGSRSEGDTPFASRGKGVHGEQHNGDLHAMKDVVMLHG